MMSKFCTRAVKSNVRRFFVNSLVIIGTFVFMNGAGFLFAQPNRRNPPSPVSDPRAIDQLAEKVQNEYLSGLNELATKYEEAGDREKAIAMLTSISRLRPESESIKTRIRTLSEAILKDNETVLEIEAGAPFKATGFHVKKGKPVRIEAEGSYRITLAETLTPAGFADRQDYNDTVSFGALVALVGAPATGGRDNRRKDAPQIVEVGKLTTLTPDQDGPLLLRLNVPADARNQGKVKVKISGHIGSK